jgi:hypothetical protein
VFTEYSNLGYSLALAGRPTVYLYEDPTGAEMNEHMRHLAVVLGAAGHLPVDRRSPESAGGDAPSAPSTSWRPSLSVDDLAAVLRQA